MVELDLYGPGDLELTLKLETDPRVMAELGGVRPSPEIERAHRNRVANNEDGGGAWFAIVVSGEDAELPPAGGPEPRRVGEIGTWESERGGERIDEVGWTLLPAFHGRGIARRALALLLARLERDGERARELVALPGVGNAPSNALCRSFGFALVGEAIDVSFRDTTLSCNEWRLALPRWRD